MNPRKSLTGQPLTGQPLTDRVVDALARRPGGLIGRFLYRKPAGHMPGFHLALSTVPLSAEDRVLEVGCGAGVFLEMALRSGCRAWAVDHSPDMVAEALTRNRAAILENRLQVREGDAGALPFADGQFSRLFCLNAFFFFPDPEAALSEMARVVEPGGLVAILTTPPGSAGWMRWVFGPIARRMRFDTPERLLTWGAAHGLERDSISTIGGSFLLVVRRQSDKEQSTQPAR